MVGLANLVIIIVKLINFDITSTFVHMDNRKLKKSVSVRIRNIFLKVELNYSSYFITYLELILTYSKKNYFAKRPLTKNRTFFILNFQTRIVLKAEFN